MHFAIKGVEKGDEGKVERMCFEWKFSDEIDDSGTESDERLLVLLTLLLQFKH